MRAVLSTNGAKNKVEIDGNLTGKQVIALAYWFAHAAEFDRDENGRYVGRILDAGGDAELPQFRARVTADVRMEGVVVVHAKDARQSDRLMGIAAYQKFPEGLVLDDVNIDSSKFFIGRIEEIAKVVTA